jgi:hypothetical protein
MWNPSESLVDAYGSAELSFTFSVTEEVASIAIIFRILKHKVRRKDAAERGVNVRATRSSTLVAWKLCA